MNWSLEENNLPLLFTWKISHGHSTFKKIAYVKVTHGEFIGVGEAAFLTKDQNRIDCKSEFEIFKDGFEGDNFDFNTLDNYLTSIKISPPMMFAISSAYIHLYSQLKSISVTEVLNTEKVESVQTSFSVPIMPPGEFKQYYESHQLERFSFLKIKIQNEQCLDLYKEVERVFRGKIRLDGNEGWKDPEVLLKFISKLDLKRIEFLEQPLCSNEYEALLYLKLNSPVELIADESVSAQNITKYHAERFHGVNIKLMKAGSYLTALRQIEQAKKLGLKVMLGCMVESSLGIWSAMQIAYGLDYYDLDGFMLFKDEPLKLVNEANGSVKRHKSFHF